MKHADKNKAPDSLIDGIKIGEVVDTNDPQQMGRLRIFCPSLGDTNEKDLADIPWAMSMSASAGMVQFGTRGPEETPIDGPTSYGLWAVPSIGAQAVVACIGGDPSLRIWMGCIQPQYMTGTQPHGRFSAEAKYGTPDGPLDSIDGPIQPLYDNLTSAFINDDSGVPGTPDDPRRNLEWRTRGADRQAAGINGQQANSVDTPHNVLADDVGVVYTEENGETYSVTQGYDVSQIEGTADFSDGPILDSTVTSLSSPGLHTLSMDDRSDNCRMRMRTTCGNQIIMDDTNERIYVSTAKGDTWVELDQAGNIDIFGARNISMKAGGDFNFTTDQTFRVHAKEGIHLYSDGEIRQHAVKDISVRTEKNLRVFSLDNTYIESGSTLHLKSVDDMFTSTNQNYHVNVTGTSHHTSGSTMNLNSAGSNIILTAAPDIHFNGPAATPAQPAQEANESTAFFSSRVPEHEPWARMFMDLSADGDSGNQHKPEYSYNDIRVGRESTRIGDVYTRNPKWHR